MNEPTPPPKIVRLPQATPEQQIERWKLDGSQRWEEVKRWGNGPDADYSVVNQAGTSDYLRDHENVASVSQDLGQGWSVAWPGSEHHGAGVKAHRGILHEDEYVDPEVMRIAVEGHLGFTAAEVHSVFRQGPLSTTQRALRDRIDARLLEVYREGGNMVLLGRQLGLAMKENGTCRAIANALARAKEAGA